MNRRGWEAGWTGTVLALVLGCNAGSGDPPPSEGDAARFAHALCAAVFRCCLPVDDQPSMRRWVGEVPDQAYCEEAVTQSLSDRLVRIQESLTGGRIAYDEGTSRACQSALEQVGCEDFVWSDEMPTRACWSFAGRVHPGGGCVEDAECAGGRCDFANGGIGTCRPTGGVGQSCARCCEAGLECSPEGLCVHPGDKLAGARCGDGDECRSGRCGPVGHDFTCDPVIRCGFGG
jgi:hypothetical protein